MLWLTPAAAFEHLLHRAARPTHALQVCVAAGRPVTSSKATSGIRAMPASSTPSMSSRAHGADADEQRTPHRQARAQRRQALADAGRARARPGDAGQLGVGRQRAS